MSADIIERLRHQFTGEYDPTGRLLQDAADEIERLRALIDAWNEAEREYFSVVNPSPDVVARFYSALDALRAEVQR